MHNHWTRSRCFGIKFPIIAPAKLITAKAMTAYLTFNPHEMSLRKFGARAMYNRQKTSWITMKAPV